jgi:predicted metalloprotease
LQAFDALGYGNIAPQAILAHEFAHHIQYNLGIKDYGIPLTPSGSRRTELMADAYAAYFLTHLKGAAMQWKDVQQAAEVFSNLGDCLFDNELHHGTPSQRMVATKWGYKLANDADKQDQIMSSREFASLFDAALNDIVQN